jgi:hypothetical protein
MKTSTMKVKQITKRPYRERFIPNGFNVYIDSNATELVDKFFSENKIYGLSFKSKTWSKMCRMTEKLNIAAMRAVYGSTPDIKYSYKTGCSCGCSPGYKVRKAFCPTLREYANCDIWATVKVDVSEIKALMPKFKEMLAEEIAIHNGLAAIA